MPSADVPSAPAGGAPEIIPISALNHFLYCARRAYLIHAERIFVDNEHTVLGNLAHEAVDTPGFEHRAGWELLRALPLFSDTLGLSGKGDIVEVRRDNMNRIVESRPVEYKKGPARRWSNDQAQLCAQALCLEEMFRLQIETGLIFYAASSLRVTVIFDSTLRAFTLDALSSLRSTLAQVASPPAVLKPQCEGCSLFSVCMPGATTSGREHLYDPRTYD